jgi:hypothetical protein
MPSCPRGDVVAQGEVAVYHCWNRCVQRACLCGRDPVTDRDYEYRRDWVQQTERLLATLFAIDIGFHAEMGNHIHLILRTRPDVAATWSEAEVVRRWLIIAKLKRNGSAIIREPTPAKQDRELKTPGRVEQFRHRLADISWFMGTLCENISRRCNRDSETSGAFWEHRFKCRSLADEAAILVCGIYVDLNQIHAGEAPTPEDSRHTSAYDRIQALQQRRAAAGSGDVASTTGSELPDAWLCELSLQAGRAADVAASAAPTSRCRASDQGLLSVSLEKYLELLDWTGRQIRADKRGAIPESLAPLLDRLGIRGAKLADAVESFHGKFGLVVGSAAAIASVARRAGRRWFRGTHLCSEAFG